jgi:hypothetical protein
MLTAGNKSKKTRSEESSVAINEMQPNKKHATASEIQTIKKSTASATDQDQVYCHSHGFSLRKARGGRFIVHTSSSRCQISGIQTGNFVSYVNGIPVSPSTTVQEMQSYLNDFSDIECISVTTVQNRSRALSDFADRPIESHHGFSVRKRRDFYYIEGITTSCTNPKIVLGRILMCINGYRTESTMSSERISYLLNTPKLNHVVCCPTAKSAIQFQNNRPHEVCTYWIRSLILFISYCIPLLTAISNPLG